ncbi:uncharacterized protein [Pseudorasbora parva]|uniref:uncharacterized protein isoform X1 n=1 Tax=Pseudorasbora parva TaxID=51549 RepID=UPI00351E137D
MEKFIFICVLSSWIMQIITSDEVLLRVQLSESVRLKCNMTDRYEVAWFHQHHKQLTQLINAKTSSVAGRKLLVTFNHNQNRLVVNADVGINTAFLVISGVSEADSGLYFCGTKSVSSRMDFEKPIRLEIEDKLSDTEDKDNSVTKPPEDVESTDEVTVTERVLMFGGVGLAVFVFFLATVAAGGIIHHHGRQKGWKEAKRSFLMRQKSAK